MGGFHAALSHAGGECVYVSEIDDAAFGTYSRNWFPAGAEPPKVNRDIFEAVTANSIDVPAHDVLTAGFPCQPFSKSGRQQGMDEIRGTVFWAIARVIQARRPSVVLLENVRNLAGPRHRHEWSRIVETLRSLGYRVSSTPQVFSPHYLPPERGGTPQIRERVFISATYVGEEDAREDIAPAVAPRPVDGWDPKMWRAEWALDPEVERGTLSKDEAHWIDVWDDFVQRMWKRMGRRLPGFPLWSDDWRGHSEAELALLPAWKQDFIRKNELFYLAHRAEIERWKADHPDLPSFPASRRKFEWQLDVANPSVWRTAIQLRPSGIRCKAPTYLPALVAITQTSIYGPWKRRLTPHEVARLQGLPDGFVFHNTRDSASYKQAGNGVPVGAVWHVLRSHVEQDVASGDPRIPDHIRRAVLTADPNPSPGILHPAAYAWMPYPLAG